MSAPESNEKTGRAVRSSGGLWRKFARWRARWHITKAIESYEDARIYLYLCNENEVVERLDEAGTYLRAARATLRHNKQSPNNYDAKRMRDHHL